MRFRDDSRKPLLWNAPVSYRASRWKGPWPRMPPKVDGVRPERKSGIPETPPTGGRHLLYTFSWWSVPPKPREEHLTFAQSGQTTSTIPCYHRQTVGCHPPERKFYNWPAVMGFAGTNVILTLRWHEQPTDDLRYPCSVFAVWQQCFRLDCYTDVQHEYQFCIVRSACVSCLAYFTFRCEYVYGTTAKHNASHLPFFRHFFSQND